MYAKVIVGLNNPAMDKMFDYAVPEGTEVRQGVRVIVPFGRRNGKSTKKPKNNFEKLKEINKIYFEPGGLLANITVDGENDPSLD